MQVSETMAQTNGFITSNGAYDDDDKPMLIIKKSMDSQGNGLTALINKQLQGEILNAWWITTLFNSISNPMLSAFASECGMRRKKNPSMELFLVFISSEKNS